MMEQKEIQFISAKIWSDYLKAMYLIKVIKPGANPYRRNYLLTFDEYETFVKTLGDSQFIVSVDVLQKYKT